MSNPLLVPLNEYYKEMMSIESKIMVLDILVTHAKDEILKEPRTNQGLVSAINIFRNLAILNGNNLFHTGYDYHLSIPQLQDEVDLILSRGYLFTFSQQYETFETFLIDILTEICFLQPENIVKLKIFEEQFVIPKTTLRQIIKDKIGREKNNKKCINSIKTLSQHFAKHETNNYTNMNISSWFDVISEVRHNVIHNRQVISEKLITYLLHQEKNSIFVNYFENRQTKDGVLIFLSKDNFNKNFQLLNSFAFFIFSSLSINSNLSASYKRLV